MVFPLGLAVDLVLRGSTWERAEVATKVEIIGILPGPGANSQASLADALLKYETRSREVGALPIAPALALRILDLLATTTILHAMPFYPNLERRVWGLLLGLQRVVHLPARSFAVKIWAPVESS